MQLFLIIIQILSAIPTIITVVQQILALFNHTPPAQQASFHARWEGILKAWHTSRDGAALADGLNRLLGDMKAAAQHVDHEQVTAEAFPASVVDTPVPPAATAGAELTVPPVIPTTEAVTPVSAPSDASA